MQLLEATLQRASRTVNTLQAVRYTAPYHSYHHDTAVVQLDCSYFLLRRQPDVLRLHRSTGRACTTRIWQAIRIFYQHHAELIQESHGMRQVEEVHAHGAIDTPSSPKCHHKTWKQQR